jgi:hypothetical protein
MKKERSELKREYEKLPEREREEKKQLRRGVCVCQRERESYDKSSDIKDIVVELFHFGLGCDLHKEATFTLTTFLFYH